MLVKPMPIVRSTGTKKKTSTRIAAGIMNNNAVALERHHVAAWPPRTSASASVRAIAALADDQLILELRLELVHRLVRGRLGLHLALLDRGEVAEDDLVVGPELRVVRDERRVVEHVLRREQELVLLVGRVILLRGEDREVRARDRVLRVELGRRGIGDEPERELLLRAARRDHVHQRVRKGDRLAALLRRRDEHEAGVVPEVLLRDLV